MIELYFHKGILKILFQFILLFAWIDYSPARYGDDYQFPPWADFLGWMMTISSAIWIPVTAIYKLCKEEGSFREVRCRTFIKTLYFEFDIKDFLQTH